ncbi:MAG: archaeosortase/exosortase family protein [Sedimentisphaerales bacterium]
MSRKKRQRHKRGPVSVQKKATGPHNKTKAIAAEAGRSSNKYSVLKFLLIFGILLAVFYVFIAFSSFYSKKFVPWHHHLIARISGYVLAVLGQEITVTGKSISSPKFSVNIIRGCDAVEAIALYVCAVLAFPLPILKKFLGMIAGTLLLLILNLVRIVSLFLIGSYSSRIFALMHLDVWQAMFIFLAVLLWILWLIWATRSQVVAQPASS